MSGRKRKEAIRAPTRDVPGVLNWAWPTSPRIFTVYDKYADMEAVLVAGAEVWTLSVQGREQVFRFPSEAERGLQQKLVMLTQVERSPSSVYKFTRSLLLNWTLYVHLLEEGPLRVQECWDDCVHDIDTAKAAKTILRLAISSSLGDWGTRYGDLVKGLDTRANAIVAAQRGKIRRRESLVSIARQAELVRVLDTRGLEPALLEQQAEGLAALALAFQHGMRPVQMLSIKLEHVHSLVDASGDPICLVSFHQAKQKDGNTVNGEMVRQVNPEWARPVVLLLEYAKSAGRTRLFSSENSEDLWSKVKNACSAVDAKVDFNISKLRHSSAQALADAGHSRKSIQWFLGHANDNAASSYVKASRLQGNLINEALGASKLYDSMVSMAFGEFVTVEELSRVDEAEQIGGIIGDTLVAGIGRCRTRQSACSYDPVISCYGCHKYIPALNPAAHMEAIAGMREQVLVFVKAGDETSATYLQMRKALAGAQRALEDSRRILGGARG
ncbi:tyrosine-type recombinase/integrase [Paraburkholderia sp. CNPSo 3272]|uniref:tyrosine-type recombinase/integrase n=1 Tax=Paraburkholderia sp. CNPSo 3272 TaxID=2940931 RepID=UPI0020B841FB|nr:tyrosine-type recombinase/integrase [Paraburkholderia sp. CNPSo 3272]MCP3725438.1 tyrosine-type recombinase/integrase [Paraburkholderia sp. CNPSo 3272]